MTTLHNLRESWEPSLRDELSKAGIGSSVEVNPQSFASARLPSLSYCYIVLERYFSLRDRATREFPS
jgi:hypothetical protein